MAGIVDALTVGWLLWRAQLQMFLNQTVRSRQAGRIAATIGGAALILLAWIWEAFITLLLVRAASRFGASVNLVSLLSLGFFAYTGVLVFSSLVFSLNALLLNPDLDLLLVAPRRVESILGGRMVVQVIRLMLLGLLFTAPALIVLALASHDPLIPLGFALVYLLYPVYIVVLISLLSLLLVRVIPAGRGRELLTLLGVGLAVGINLLNFLVNPALRAPGPGQRPRFRPTLPDIPAASSPWLPSGWAGRAGAAILSSNWLAAVEWMSLLLVVSALLFAGGAMLSGRLYLAGWVQAVRPRRHAPRQVTRRAPGRRLALLGPVEAGIVVKDWRMRTRDLAQLVRFVMPVVFLVLIFGLRFPRTLDAVQQLGQGPVAATLGLVPAWILLFSLALSLGLTAVSLEGKSIWIFAASPNTTLSLLEAKCWSTAIPTAAVIGIVTLVAEAVIRPGLGWAVAAVIAAVALSAGVTGIMVGLGAMFARFDWTDARRMMHPAGLFLGMFAFGIVSIGTAALFGISLAIASITRFPVVTTWLGAMLIAVGATAAAAALSLLIGNARLRGLELG
ncbi:MAG TPA: hypothetical protein VIT43_13855 [Candidatus Dormibacteraeota bacterium]